MEKFQTSDIPKSPRIQKLVDALYEHMPVIESARAKLITESYKETEGEPIITRRAKAFAHILHNIPIIIRDNELIVGSSTIAPRGCQTFPEFSYEWLAIASSGVLGTTNAAGELLTGSDVTIAAFETVLGSAGGWLVTIGIALFAFSTILGWEYHGEKAFEYLFGTHKYNMVYRIIFSLVVYIGCTQTLSLVWNFSDIANALMAIPNLICMLLLSGEIAKDVKEFQPEIKK